MLFLFVFFTLDSGKYLWPNEKKLQRTPYVSKTSPLFPMALARDVASDANFDRIVILLKKWPSYTLHCCKSRAAGCQYNLQHNYISKKHTKRPETSVKKYSYWGKPGQAFFFFFSVFTWEGGSATWGRIPDLRDLRYAFLFRFLNRRLVIPSILLFSRSQVTFTIDLKAQITDTPSLLVLSLLPVFVEIFH